MSTAIIDTVPFGTDVRRYERSVGHASQSTARAPKPTSRLRMTRRGRMVLTVAMAVPLAAGAWLAVGSGDDAVATGTSSSASFEYVQVESGQSLWQIASAVAPAEDPRDVVSAIVRLNGLTSSDVFPGQRLGIPEQYRH